MQLYKHTHAYVQNTLRVYDKKGGQLSSVIKTGHIQEVWELFLLESIANQSPYDAIEPGLCVCEKSE